MNGTEKQIAYAQRIRSEALKQLDEFVNIFEGTKTFYGKNMVAIYKTGRKIILSFDDASDLISSADKVISETKMLASKWEQHYNYCKQHCSKPHSIQFILAHTTPAALGLRYISAETIDEEA